MLLPLAADPLAAAGCRSFDTTELPRLGGLDGGAWLSSSRVALTDVTEHRFLVYELDRETVEAVEPLAKGHDPQRVVDLTAVRDGFVMAGMYREEHRFLEGSTFLRLDPSLKPVTTYSWPQEWGDDIHSHDRDSGRPNMADEVEGMQDSFVAWTFFSDREGIMRFALPADDESTAVTPTGFWPAMPIEAHPRVPLFSSRLAATVGEDADAYALRVGDEGPFIQRLAGSGERLNVFPVWSGQMPDLPPVAAMEHYPQWWKAVENSSFPASIYAEGEHLYLLVRSAEEDGPRWDLHAVDPVADTLLHRVRLPTRAAHLSLVPGPEHWALVEGSSYFEDEMRRPKRLLLLDSRVIRNGEELSCS